MANKKVNQAVAKKSIIDAVVNGLTTIEVIEDIKKRLESIEKSAFNVALACAYSLGVTIPAYTDVQGNEHAEALCEKPIKTQAELLKLIGRSKATLSRWIKAMNLIIENGYFTEFSTGSLPFSYDKIICIFEHKDIFEGYVIADLMNFTVDTLEDFVAKKAKSAEVEEETEEVAEEEVAEETEAEVEEVPAEEITTLIYNGKEYKVNKATFEKWLAENAITE